MLARNPTYSNTVNFVVCLHCKANKRQFCLVSNHTLLAACSITSLYFVVCLFSATAKPGGRIRCQYFSAVDKVLFVDDYAVGCRKDLNGILLLDTALQPPVAKPEDIVQLELPVTEVREECEYGRVLYCLRLCFAFGQLCFFYLLVFRIHLRAIFPFARESYLFSSIREKLRKGKNYSCFSVKNIECPLC